MTIQKKLLSLQDMEYRDFNAKLIPNIDKDSIIGVRTPELRKFAKELAKSEKVSAFFKALPHQYFEENQLHAFLISEMKDYDKAIAELTRFLPYVDNWATCDQLRPKIFRKYSDRLIEEVRKWIVSDKMYTIRFGIGMLMRWYLDEYFKLEYLNLVAEVQSEEYYVNMMRAWYFATALAKQYDAAVRIIEENQLDTWTHNKTIQKARESYRISDEQKEYLKTLKRMHN
ncbi:MAG: DNA alkylation repair protein [Oscillospiraceae bacterium]|nr:DNA alkylation repair protein [Oscillospiraceae bacterium]MDE6005361.1 DNA alkylation repair protein [Oscillospiraceae bacterium]